MTIDPRLVSVSSCEDESKNYIIPTYQVGIENRANYLTDSVQVEFDNKENGKVSNICGEFWSEQSACASGQHLGGHS